MKALVVGSGGREHALAWTLSRSRDVGMVFVAPGNGGTDGSGMRSVSLKADDVDGLLDFARAEGVELTVIGPEQPLADGIVDRFTAAGLRCFGPTAAAAQIEASKAWSKAFMDRHGIPTARWGAFTELAPARDFVETFARPPVIKASGLAAGKGVLLPLSRAAAVAAVEQVLCDRAFGDAGRQVVIEERLEGPELSVLGFTDGEAVAAMPAARDHKRAWDGDRGPNTGGMGAIAPVAARAEVAEIVETVLRRTVAGMAAEGRRYVGVLYAGIMWTADGPRVLEFNCRLGDPETQVLLPLLETDLSAICGACIDGTLADLDVRWSGGAAAAVVAASRGYPGDYDKGLPITGVEAAGEMNGVTVFQAGTRRRDGALRTAGGRVLAVTGRGPDRAAAIARAYAGLAEIHFDGLMRRTDIGRSSQSADGSQER